MATEEPSPPGKYWIGASLAAVFVLFGLIATLGVIAAGTQP
jgi:hypothetical protein